jgi:hypothetical protein
MKKQPEWLKNISLHFCLYVDSFLHITGVLKLWMKYLFSNNTNNYIW